ncbi:MAG TPA: rod shape-determining protein RodA, partial [Rubricoccaceae bacterium]|nr:rod shape-determining protein RodA [Rubricoccaceae bacterium]
ALGALGALASFGTAIGAWLGLTKVLQPHQVARIVAFADPEAFRATAGFHVIQAKAAIGSGGLFGKGFTNGTQTQLAYIPENSTDFIFCVIGEEFGFVGATVLLVLFGVFLVRLAGLGAASGFAFPRLFVAGVTGVFLVHILINVGMTVGLVPVIGIPLPLISYGGSALLANTAMVAVALNLHARRDEFAIYTG